MQKLKMFFKNCAKLKIILGKTNAKAGLAYFSLIVVLLNSGCNVCNNGIVAVQDSQIYFSAMPLNGTTPSIFGMSLNDYAPNEAVKDAQLLSMPSQNGILVFFRQKSNGAKVLYRCKLNGDSIVQFVADNYYSAVDMPVISNDGHWTAFYRGGDTLLIDKDFNLTKDASLNYCIGSISSFSPNGNYLAFFEGNYLSGPITVKVIDINNSTPISAIIFQKTISSGFGEVPYASIKWSSDGKMINYIIDGGIYIDTIAGGSKFYNLGKINTLSFALSPDNRSLAYIADDGNLKKRNFSDTVIITQLTEIDSNYEYIDFPEWSLDGKKIILTSFHKNESTANKYRGALEIVDIETKEKQELCNNVWKGFWNPSYIKK